MKRKSAISEKARTTPVVHECDVCVAGGSCTGVFAAVRAARLGAKVAIIEKQNSFGGVATQGLVNVWHSFMDTEFKKEIIAGLSLEVLERLRHRNAVKDNKNSADVGFRFNSSELKIELDQLVRENRITPFLHTFMVSPHLRDGKLDAVIIENKSGRAAIKAKIFIDATGDGDLAARLGLQFVLKKHLQPPTTCANIYGSAGLDIGELIREHHKEFKLPYDWGWRSEMPGLPGITMHAETHVFDVDCSNAEDLTYAEMEGRRTVRAYMDIIRKYTNRKPVLANIASYIGVRETRHFKCRHRITEKDVLNGRKFDDAIGYGSYRVDVHHEDRPGITFRYLDGRESIYIQGKGWTESRWRPETAENPTFYQIPYSSMVPVKFGNLIICGRSIDCDTGSFGAIRVMVNMNQTGEAAGVAAAIALDSGKPVDKIDSCELRRKLKKGGSIIF